MKQDETGHVLVLALGLALVCFAVAGLALDGTRVFLARRTLQNSADSGAVAAAADIDARAYYRSGGSTIRLDPSLGENTVSRMLERRSLMSDVLFAVSEGGVEVVLRSEVETTFLKLVGIDTIPVAASAWAEPFPQAPTIGR